MDFFDASPEDFGSLVHGLLQDEDDLMKDAFVDPLTSPAQNTPSEESSQNDNNASESKGIKRPRKAGKDDSQASDGVLGESKVVWLDFHTDGLSKKAMRLKNKLLVKARYYPAKTNDGRMRVKFSWSKDRGCSSCGEVLSFDPDKMSSVEDVPRYDLHRKKEDDFMDWLCFTVQPVLLDKDEDIDQLLENLKDKLDNDGATDAELWKAQLSINESFLGRLKSFVSGKKKGDIAYLYRVKDNEHLDEGDVVGVHGTMVSKCTVGAQWVSVVATSGMVRFQMNPEGLDECSAALIVHAGRARFRLEQGSEVPSGGNLSVYASSPGRGVVARTEEWREKRIGFFFSKDESDTEFCFVTIGVGLVTHPLVDEEVVLNLLLQRLKDGCKKKHIIPRRILPEDFDPDVDLGDGTLSIVHGEAGCGKSWAIEAWLLQKYKRPIGIINLKVFLDWCEKEKVARVEGPTILKFLLPSSEFKPDETWASLARSKRELILVFDGLDEVMLSKKSDFLGILCGDDPSTVLGLPKHIRLIVACRTESLKYLRHAAKKYVLEELDSVERTLLIENCLTSKPDRAGQVEEYCEKFEIQSPLVISILCQVVGDKKLANASKSDDILRVFVSQQLTKAQKKKLRKVAWYHFVLNKVVKKPKKNAPGIFEDGSFCHLLFLEFFAAWYVCKKESKLQKERVKYQMENSSSFCSFLVFFSKCGKTMFKHFFDILKEKRALSVCKAVVVTVSDVENLKILDESLSSYLLYHAIREGRVDVFDFVLKNRQGHCTLIKECITLAARMNRDDMLRRLLERNPCVYYACMGTIQSRHPDPVGYLVRFFGEDREQDIISCCMECCAMIGSTKLMTKLLPLKIDVAEGYHLLQLSSQVRRLDMFNLLTCRFNPNDKVLETVAENGWFMELLKYAYLLKDSSVNLMHFENLEADVIRQLVDKWGITFTNEHDLFRFPREKYLDLIPILIKDNPPWNWLRFSCKWSRCDLIDRLIGRYVDQKAYSHWLPVYDSAWDIAICFSIEEDSDLALDYLLNRSLHRKPFVRASALICAARKGNMNLLREFRDRRVQILSDCEVAEILCGSVRGTNTLETTFQVFCEKLTELPNALKFRVLSEVMQCADSPKPLIVYSLNELPWQYLELTLNDCLKNLLARSEPFAKQLFVFIIERDLRLIDVATLKMLAQSPSLSSFFDLDCVGGCRESKTIELKDWRVCTPCSNRPLHIRLYDVDQRRNKAQVLRRAKKFQEACDEDIMADAFEVAFCPKELGTRKQIVSCPSCEARRNFFPVVMREYFGDSNLFFKRLEELKINDWDCLKGLYESGDQIFDKVSLILQDKRMKTFSSPDEVLVKESLEMFKWTVSEAAAKFFEAFVASRFTAQDAQQGLHILLDGNLTPSEQKCMECLLGVCENKNARLNCYLVINCSRQFHLESVRNFVQHFALATMDDCNKQETLMIVCREKKELQHRNDLSEMICKSIKSFKCFDLIESTLNEKGNEEILKFVQEAMRRENDKV